MMNHSTMAVPTMMATVLMIIDLDVKVELGGEDVSVTCQSSGAGSDGGGCDDRAMG